MEIMMLTLGVFLGVVLVMSVGILFKRKPIAGSCGGIANLMGSCDVCEMKSECIDKNKSTCSDNECEDD